MYPVPGRNWEVICGTGLFWVGYMCTHTHKKKILPCVCVSWGAASIMQQARWLKKLWCLCAGVSKNGTIAFNITLQQQLMAHLQVGFLENIYKKKRLV